MIEMSLIEANLLRYDLHSSKYRRFKPIIWNIIFIILSWLVELSTF